MPIRKNDQARVACGLNHINPKHFTGEELMEIRRAAEALKINQANRPPRDILMEIKKEIAIETWVMSPANDPVDSMAGKTALVDVLKRVRRFKKQPGSRLRDHAK